VSSWLLWLLAPAGAVALAAVVSWLRARPAKPLSTDDAMRAHAAYLDALGSPARSRDRGPRKTDD